MNQYKKVLLLFLSLSSLSMYAMGDGNDVFASPSENQGANNLPGADLTRIADALQELLNLQRKSQVNRSYLIPDFSAITYTPKNCAKLAALIFFIWTVVKFQLTEPSNIPVRYSWDEIMAGKNLLKNIKYLILDGLIGHKSKRPSMRVYPDGKVSAELCEAYDDLKSSHQTGTVVLRPGAYSKGIYGWIHDHTSPTLTALALLTTITTKRSEFEAGLAAFVTYFGLNADNSENDSAYIIEN